jgi:hypothetical protein
MRLYALIVTLSLLFIIQCGQGKKGCTDPNARNFDPQAEDDNGSCNYPTQGRTPLLVFFSSTTNSDAGSFALPNYQQAIQEWGNSIIPLVAFPSPSDPLFSPSTVAIASALNSSFIPSFSLGNQHNLANWNALQNAFQQQSSNSVASLDVDVYGYQNDSIEVEYYGIFHGAAQGDFFADVWCLEDRVQWPQAGVNQENFRHRFVLRSSASDSGIGFPVASGEVESGHSFRRRLKIPVSGSWIFGNLTFVGVIWRNDAGGLQFVNARVGR